MTMYKITSNDPTISDIPFIVGDDKEAKDFVELMQKRFSSKLSLVPVSAESIPEVPVYTLTDSDTPTVTAENYNELASTLNQLIRYCRLLEIKVSILDEQQTVKN